MGAQVREENLVLIAKIIDAQLNNFYSVLQNGRLINRAGEIIETVAFIFLFYFFHCLKTPWGKTIERKIIPPSY